MKSKDIRPLNDKNQAHGYWEMDWNDKSWYKSYFINGKRIGYTEWYNHISGEFYSKEFYII